MEPLRLAELLAGLSLVADIGMGLSPGEAGRAAILAMELADLAAADDPSDVYYTTLMQHVGCTGYAHEAAAMLGGDEIAVKSAALRATPAPASGFARQVQEGYSRANCEVAAMTAQRLGLGEGVVRSLHEIYEWWSGDGAPQRLAGEEIALPARIVQVAADAAVRLASSADSPVPCSVSVSCSASA